MRETSALNGEELMEKHGILLQSARGPIPSLPTLVVGKPINGSWWAHPDHGDIFRVLNEAVASDRVVRLRLVNGKVTLVHRRLWPALVRLADQLGPSRLASLQQEHTSSGSHRSTSAPFPDWVPEDVLEKAASLSYEDAIAQLPACLRTD